MDAAKDSKRYSNWLKFLGLSLKQLRLYSENHPTVKQTLDILRGETDLLLSQRKQLTLGLAGDKFIIDGTVIDAKDTQGSDFLDECRRVGIESFCFLQGLDPLELNIFLKIMALRPKELQAKGGFKKIFEEAALGHIKLLSARFEMVQDGQKVVAEGEKGGPEDGGPGLGPGAGTGEGPGHGAGPGAGGGGPQMVVPGSMKELIEVFKEESSGEVSYNYEKLNQELTQEPGFVAKLMIKSAQTPQEFTRIIERMGTFFKDEVTPRHIEARKDLSKTTSKIVNEYKKTLNQAEVPEGFKLVGEKFPNLLDECADKVRVEIMANICAETQGDLKSLTQWGGKLLKEEDVRGRLKEVLRERLTGLGLSEDIFGQVFEGMGEKRAAKKSKKEAAAGKVAGGADISEEELTELKIKAKKLDELETKYRLVEKEKKQLMDEKERVETIIHNLAEGVVVVDNTGKILLMNPAAEKLLGLEHGKGAGGDIRENLKEEHLLALAKGPLHSNDETPKQVELQSLNTDTQRVLQASTAVIENEDGKTVGMVSVLSDITRQKELNEIKSKFVSHVSHELRTPLVAIQRSLALLLEEQSSNLGPDQKQYLEIANRNIGRLGRLINDILDLSKIEAGKLEIRPMFFSLPPLLQDVKSTFATWAADKKIEISLKIQQESMIVEADRDRINQVLVNLVSNALKYTPEEGTITIEAAVVRDESLSPGDCVEAGVRDTGIGIPPQDQKRIFERFEQVSLNQPAGVSSTGLGLTIAREIIELHGGRIWVESEQGKGSRFAFRIPMKASPSGEERSI